MLQSSFFTSGLGHPDFATLLLRVLLGGFFLLARFRWVYDPSRPQARLFNTDRHKHLQWKLCTCGYSPALAAFLACGELSAGIGVVLGLFTPIAVMVLLIILVFATICTAQEKVREQKPVDCIDCVSCYLWRVEGCYITLAIVILAIGPGAFSLDALLWR